MKRYLFLLLLPVLACWSAWLYVLFNFDPYQGGFISHLFFYASLLLAMAGTFTMLAFILRTKFITDGKPWHQMRTSFRQGFLLSIIFIATLCLISQDMLRWWNEFLLILAVIVVEAIFQVKSEPKRRLPPKQAVGRAEYDFRTGNIESDFQVSKIKDDQNLK